MLEIQIQCTYYSHSLFGIDRSDHKRGGSVVDGWGAGPPESLIRVEARGAASGRGSARVYRAGSRWAEPRPPPRLSRYRHVTVP